MKEYYRIIDVNLNRLSEALRTIEEYARFCLNNKNITEKLKNIRHEINKNFEHEYNELIKARDSISDVGPKIKNPTTRNDSSDILKANYKRAQQSLRVLEEYSKLININFSSQYENMRYELYTLEKVMISEASLYYRNKKLENRKLYLVTDRSQYSDLDKFFDSISMAIKGGVDIVQLREKEASTKEFINIGRVVKEICSLADVLFIINDRVDIALAVNADGVHLGQDDMDINQARKILGDLAIIGNSTHKPEDAINAMKDNADYIGVGPVFSTPTKPGRKAVGFEYVEWASKNVKIPFFAIGGIDTNNIQEVINAGAKRIAVVRSIINSTNPEEAARLMLNKLENNKEVITQ